ncbi:MAG: archaeosortase/exosortase family protein [Planctomycetes bacterium]|nr:archaeosortase/exosortase family protein [Planctomycetota bacterium]
MPDTPDNGDTHNQKQGRKSRRGGGKLPVFRFVLVMVILLIAFNVFFYGWFSKSDIFDGYLSINADVSAVILGFLGERGVTVEDSVIMSPRFSLGIKRGCDAIQPAVFFAFFVAASPVRASRRRKAKAIAIGIALILLINLVRLVSLFYVGILWKSAFEWVHIEFWQMVFIALPIVFWLVWARRQQLKDSVRADASD